MEGRADNPIYARALSKVENWIILPQGGVTRKAGFEYIADLNTTDSLNVRMTNFKAASDQDYLQTWRDKELKIFADAALASTITTVFATSEVRELRVAQSQDTQIITHFNHPPQSLLREGSDTAWSLGAQVFNPLPFFRFNTSQTLTASVATVGAGRTFTLSGTDGYWNAGHFGNSIEIKTNNGQATLTTPQQNATGGTALASAGSAANAFDGNDLTTCDAGANGWIGYTFGAATAVRVVGIHATADVTLNLTFETDDNASFTSATAVGTAVGTTDSTGFVYIDLPRHTGETNFRIRETGGATLAVKDVVFNAGLVALGDITDALDNTNADAAWTEQAWGTHHGYPRTVTFLNNRLVFGGTRDEPSTLFFSKAGDFFNFDDTATNADNAFAVTLATDQQHRIRDMREDRGRLIVFTSDGVFEVSGDGSPITPTNANNATQSRVGVSTVAVTEADGALHYNGQNGKDIIRIQYSFGQDQYVDDYKTTIAHHLFVDGQKPRGMATLRSYKDTQANLMFIPREDGQMAVYTTDQDKEVQAWSRFVTYNPNGSQASFRDCAVVETSVTTTSGVVIRPVLYAVVERIVDGATKTFIEALTENDTYLDHWYTGVATNTQVATAAIANGGTGYAVDDLLTVSGGTAVTAAILKVKAVDGSGVITSVSINEEGEYTANPTNPVSVTGGTGTGATFTLTFELKPKTSWSGLTTLPNSTVTVVGDGLVLGTSTVDGSGNFTTNTPVTTINAGINYNSQFETMTLRPIVNNVVVRGIPLLPKKAIVDLYKTLSLKINDRPIYFRDFNTTLLDSGLTEFTGEKEITIDGSGTGGPRNPKLKVTVDEPVQATVLTITVDAKGG